MGLFEAVGALPLRDILSRLGSPHNVRTCACPACGAERRGSRDTRFAANLIGERGWSCKRCGAKGDGILYLEFVLCGRKIETGDKAGWAEFRSKIEQMGIETGGEIARKDWRSEPQRPPNRERPPKNEVDSVWLSGLPASKDREVAKWLLSRGLTPGLLESNDMVRALSPSAEDYPWMTNWMRRSRRAILPVYDARGERISLRFRAVCEVKGPKSVGPNGKADVRPGVRGKDSLMMDEGKVIGPPYSLGAAVLADPLGRSMLRGEERPVNVVICEGEPDFLSMFEIFSSSKNKAAIFGIWSGGWTEEISSAIPAGTRVCVAAHADRAGDEFAAAIGKTLRGRCTLFRVSPPQPLTEQPPRHDEIKRLE